MTTSLSKNDEKKITASPGGLKDLLDQGKQYLNFFFDHLDIDQAERIFELLAECPGNIIFSGVGKSGLVAQKIAATMTSTGSRSFFLCPANALHGDLGIITHQDILVLLSKSGESEELLGLIPHLRNKGCKLIAVVSNPESRIAQQCDMFISLPVEKELCPFDMAPTTSTAIQLIFGDILAIGLMKRKQFSLDDFAFNHPAGRIGRRISLKVRDLMLIGDRIPACSQDTRLVNLLVELSNKKCGCMLVVDKKNTLLGIFTDGDLRRSLQKHGPEALQMSVHMLMTKQPKYITPEELAWTAMQTMESNGGAVTVLPVLNEEGTVLGLIRLHDIIQAGL